MSVPESVAADPTAVRQYQSPPRRRGSWRAERPGETLGSPQPSAGPLGSQGPDQGYALKLARRFEDRLVLRPGEHAADVIEGACAVALRRASLHARAPVADDIRAALAIWGFLAEAPDELVELRRQMFAELHHSPGGYGRARAIVAAVPESTYRLSADAVCEAQAEDWRSLLGLASP